MKNELNRPPATLAGDAPAKAAKMLKRGERLPSLDGLRGIAVLLVMLFHFMNEPSLNHGVIKPLFLLAHIGQTGVDLFFVLSGFLITGILLDTKHESRYFRNFYMRRTLRIFPLYYGVLIILYVLLPLFSVRSWWPDWQMGAGYQFWQWFYLTNVACFLGVPQIPGHFWTLAVEEHFYLLWPLVIFCLTGRPLQWVCIAVVITAFLVRSALAWRGMDTFYLTPCRMDALAIGAWLALRIRQDPAPANLLISARTAVLWAGIVLVPFYLSVTGSHSPYLQATKFLAIGIWYGALLLWLTLEPSTGLIARFATHPLLKFFGKYSYGLYVFHVFALYALAGRMDMVKLVQWSHSVPVGTCLWLILATMASLAPAWLSWHLYEKQFLKLKKYFAPASYISHSVNERRIA